jgi:hypothetical protein
VLRVALVLAILALFVAASWRARALHESEALGLAVVMSLTAPTCYYYSFFLLAALLARHDRVIEGLVLGSAAASAWLATWPASLNTWWDDRYLMQSLVFLALALALAARRAGKQLRAIALIGR